MTHGLACYDTATITNVVPSQYLWYKVIYTTSFEPPEINASQSFLWTNWFLQQNNDLTGIDKRQSPSRT